MEQQEPEVEAPQLEPEPEMLEDVATRDTTMGSELSDDLSAWLRSLMLEDYADAFRQAGYLSLRSLQDTDLQDILASVDLKGPHVRVLAAAWLGLNEQIMIAGGQVGGGPTPDAREPEPQAAPEPEPEPKEKPATLTPLALQNDPVEGRSVPAGLQMQDEIPKLAEDEVESLLPHSDASGVSLNEEVRPLTLVYDVQAEAGRLEPTTPTTRGVSTVTPADLAGEKAARSIEETLRHALVVLDAISLSSSTPRRDRQEADALCVQLEDQLKTFGHGSVPWSVQNLPDDEAEELCRAIGAVSVLQSERDGGDVELEEAVGKVEQLLDALDRTTTQSAQKQAVPELDKQPTVNAEDSLTLQMTSCTFMVSCVPNECATEPALKAIFQTWADDEDFVQASFVPPRVNETDPDEVRADRNCALVTFKTAHCVDELFEATSTETGVSRPAPSELIDRPITLRSFEQDNGVPPSQQCLAWVEGGTGFQWWQNSKYRNPGAQDLGQPFFIGLSRISVHMASSKLSTGNFHETWKIACKKARNKFTQGSQLFLVIEEGYNLTLSSAIRGLRHGNPYCSVMHQEDAAFFGPEAAQHQQPMLARAVDKDADSDVGEQIERNEPSNDSWTSRLCGTRPKNHEAAPEMPWVKVKPLGQTKVVMNNSRHPVWDWVYDNDFYLPRFGSKGWIFVDVIDWNRKGQDADIGRVCINLDLLEQNAVVEGYYDVLSPDGTSKSGQIKLRLLLSALDGHEHACRSAVADQARLKWILGSRDITYIQHKLDENALSSFETGRVTWHIHDCVRVASMICDVDGDGSIKPKELRYLMETAFGERLSDQELGEMIAEAKSWAWPTHAPDSLHEISRSGLTKALQAWNKIINDSKMSQRRLTRKQQQLMQRIDDEHFQTIISLLQPKMRIISLPIDSMVVTQGDKASEGFILISGKMEVWANGRLSAPIESSGALFGEAGFNLLADPAQRVRGASIRAVAPTLLFAISGEAIVAAIQSCRDEIPERLEGVRPLPTWCRALSLSYPLVVDFASDQAVISRDEFAYMLREYPLRPIVSFEATQDSNLPARPRLTVRNGGGSAHIAPDRKWKQAPAWMSDLAQSHTPLVAHQDELKNKRTPAAFWDLLQSRLKQLLLRTKADPGCAQSAKSGVFRQEDTSMNAKSLGWTIRQIDPPSSFTTHWDLLQVFLLAYVIISVPYQAAFDKSADPGSFMWLFEACVDLYFLVDIGLNFRTPFFIENRIVVDGRLMAWNYAKSWFLIDLFSCASLLQYVFLITSSGDPDAASSARATKGLRLLRLAKLLRLARLKRVFDRFSGDDRVSEAAPFMNILGLVLLIVFAMHMFASFWYWVGSGDGWVEEIFVDENQHESAFTRYLTSMYSIMLQEFLEDGKQTNWERVFALVSMLLNGFLFGFVTATLSSILMALKAPYAEFNSKMDILRAWMRTKKLPRTMRNIIEAHYERKLTGNEKKVINETAILAELQPAPLATELVHVLYSQKIESVPIFSGLKDEIIVKICMLLQPIPALKGTPVIVQGTTAKHIYVVNSGKLQAWRSSNSVRMRAKVTVGGITAWASVHEVAGETGELMENKAYARALEKLTLSNLLEQADFDGVDKADRDMAVNEQNDGKKSLLDAIVRRVQGGTVDLKGKETFKCLRHSALGTIDSVNVQGKCRHASYSATGVDHCERQWFTPDFDITIPWPGVSGVCPIKVETGQVVDVLEVRQGSVVGYLEAGHCFGENFDTKYDQNVTACELCDLCFLEKDSVQELSLEHPELHQSIEDFIAKRKREEGSRALFNEFDAMANGKLDEGELRQLMRTLGMDKAIIDREIESMPDRRRGQPLYLNREEFEAWFAQWVGNDDSGTQAPGSASDPIVGTVGTARCIMPDGTPRPRQNLNEKVLGRLHGHDKETDDFDRIDRLEEKVDVMTAKLDQILAAMGQQQQIGASLRDSLRESLAPRHEPEPESL